MFRVEGSILAPTCLSRERGNPGSRGSATLRLNGVSGFRLKAGMTEWYGNHTSSVNCYSARCYQGDGSVNFLVRRGHKSGNYPAEQQSRSYIEIDPTPGLLRVWAFLCRWTLRLTDGPGDLAADSRYQPGGTVILTRQIAVLMDKPCLDLVGEPEGGTRQCIVE